MLNRGGVKVEEVDLRSRGSCDEEIGCKRKLVDEEEDEEKGEEGDMVQTRRAQRLDWKRIKLSLNDESLRSSEWTQNHWRETIVADEFSMMCVQCKYMNHKTASICGVCRLRLDNPPYFEEKLFRKLLEEKQFKELMEKEMKGPEEVPLETSSRRRKLEPLIKDVEEIVDHFSQWSPPRSKAAKKGRKQASDDDEDWI